jgi:hypothetical protein
MRARCCPAEPGAAPTCCCCQVAAAPPDPPAEETNLNAPAIKKWLSNGAEPSETVASLLKKAMILE